MTQEEVNVKVNGSTIVHIYVSWAKIAVLLISFAVGVFTISRYEAINAVNNLGLRPVTELFIMEHTISKIEFVKYVEDSNLCHNKIDSILTDLNRKMR